MWPKFYKSNFKGTHTSDTNDSKVQSMLTFGTQHVTRNLPFHCIGCQKWFRLTLERFSLGDWKYLRRHFGNLGGINMDSTQNQFGASPNYYVRFCTEHHPEFWHTSIITGIITLQLASTSNTHTINKSSTHILTHMNKLFICWGLQPTIFKTVNTSTQHKSTS